MNGCNYCVIIHNRKRRGRRRARGIAMCLAQEEMTRCHKKFDERGPGCEYHDMKTRLVDQNASTTPPVISVNGQGVQWSIATRADHEVHLPQ